MLLHGSVVLTSPGYDGRPASPRIVQPGYLLLCMLKVQKVSCYIRAAVSKSNRFPNLREIITLNTCLFIIPYSGYYSRFSQLTSLPKNKPVNKINVIVRDHLYRLQEMAVFCENSIRYIVFHKVIDLCVYTPSPKLSSTCVKVFQGIPGEGHLHIIVTCISTSSPSSFSAFQLFITPGPLPSRCPFLAFPCCN